MVKARKIYLVTATHHPYHGFWTKLAEELSHRLNLELEVRYEDYLFLIEHGDTDEYGMAWVPQILVELDDGSITVLLSQLPLNESLQPDANRAIEIMMNKIRELETQ
ncbi:MAG: hypothetical protein QXX35_02125 [Desulfurococcaceae archaeon]|uniref:Uncharacterized protein n=1 Tax=Staphylothermus marinus TaxID=2280 RepID=A0A7C4HDB6_STAMA